MEDTEPFVGGVTKKNAFTSKGVLHFAKINGWKLVDSARFSENRASHWWYNGQAVFPLTSAGFSDTIVNNSQLKYFPSWFDGQLSVYKFKSGWISIEPGNANSNDVDGFVVIKNDGGEIAVYHLWGE